MVKDKGLHKRSLTEGAATKNLLCSDPGSEDGYVFLEFIQEETDQATKKKSTEKNEDGVFSYMMGLMNKKDLSDSEDSESVSTVSEDSPRKRSTSLFPSFYFPSPFGSLTTSNPKSPKSPGGSLSPRSFFFSFGSSVPNLIDRQVPPSRSECNRVHNSYFESFDARGEVWEGYMNSFMEKYRSSGEMDDVLVQKPSTMEVHTCKSPVSPFDEDEEKKDSGSDLDFESVTTVTTHTSGSKPPALQGLHRTRTITEIDRDLPRTYPTLTYFQDFATRDSIRSVLTRCAKTYPEIGYVQGMNYIVAQLYLHSKQDMERTWQLLSNLIEHPGYNFYGVFSPGLPILQSCVSLLGDFLKTFKPVLFAHLKNLGMEHMHFTYHWFVTLFAYTMPFETLVQVWDNFFRTGWEAIFRISIVLICSLEEELLQSNFETAMQVLRAAPIFPPENLISESYKLKFSKRQLGAIIKAIRRPCFYKPVPKLKLRNKTAPESVQTV
uniref:Rab-GAP TBC domain-containing protein n=1 Tax=Mucochytrium quahogii TaxID=96639 RepID=A0A7S2RRT3_9STRA|mmetsp:Transcript_12417/g.20115  ORF Transcript_12417/g.20115 Transcript_12417/m.20115 type:complete len:492 (+) Transcript_12417:238-1713(+)|eukprot:CAMPEP_0203779312 /NCGR_PEP_ID=MMETSP0099_2-20121227/8615_1 /ASSEMBLY_ACC=CAM_ASM_000209 /TAXON_ID=96639 /ORGANISM=" , Strain NY0313808BC1" /LENGTH=491 /DNA_ID=CAMNT_0050679183 /DNA_START=180 /DNA_END=1655 /DNA_ORIENTATION=+